MPWLVLAMLVSFDLDAVKNEPNLERRAELALDNAHAALDRAKDYGAKSEFDLLHKAVLEVQASVEVCYQALEATGKDPRKNTRQFKKVEMRIRDLTRRVRSFADVVSVEDRPVVERVANRLDEIRDDIVGGIFSKRKKP